MLSQVADEVISPESFHNVDLRRGGGSENPIIIPLGLMLLALGALAIIFNRLKQSNIIACIIIGMVVGGTGLGDHVSVELTNAFIELGIILVLFMGGLEVDVEAFMSRWQLVLVNGLGQIGITFGIFSGLAVGTGLTTEATDTIFFGLACTLSSTILVLGALKTRDEMESLHGQVILGLMVLQDVVAVVSLAVLETFNPKNEGGSLGVDIAIMFGKFAAMLIILAFLARFVLDKLFRLFAVSAEMLFIGTVGYAFGVAALCGLAKFSPEIGGFFAGVSLSAVPYRLEIEHKVEPIKAFGVVLFFFMLGINLHITEQGLKDAAGWSLLIGLLTVFVFPVIMWFLGYVTGLKGRTAFLMGNTINQISEFSLILSQLANKYEVFTTKQFQIVTFATLVTLLFSSIGHVNADKIYDKIAFMLKFLDANSKVSEEEEDEFEFKDHIALLGFNETGLEIAEVYRKQGKDVLVIQLDPALDKTFKKAYKHPSARAARRASTASVREGKRGSAAAAVAQGNGGVVGPAPENNVLSALHRPPSDPTSSAMQPEAPAPSHLGAISTFTNPGPAVFPTSAIGTFPVYPPFGAAPPLVASNPMFVYGSSFGNGEEQGQGNGGGGPEEVAIDMKPSEHSPDMCSNIYSAYADPEAPDTWEHFKLKDALLVVSCMVGGQDAEVMLSRELKEVGVPFMAITNSNTEANELYEAGCLYVIQQEYLAAQTMRELITREMAKGKGECFKGEQAAHMAELERDSQNPTLVALQKFL